MRLTFAERVQSHVDPNGPVPDHAPDLGPCAIWTGGFTSHGYARMSIDGKQRKMHLVLWEMAYGPVPEGLELDHLCRVRKCIRLDHLEAVTHAENMRRSSGFNVRTHCKRGHQLTEDNVRRFANGNRTCLTCSRAENLRRYYLNRDHSVGT